MIKEWKRFLNEEDGLGTVEIVIIIAVLVGLALIFRKAIFSFLNQIIGRLFKAGDSATSQPGTSDYAGTYTFK